MKSLGLGRLDIGERYTGPPVLTDDLLPSIAERNASISRVVAVPRQLAPDGYNCTRFRQLQTGNCLPVSTADAGSDVERVSTVGAYPPIVYVPMGLAARATDTPYHAFLAARLVALGMSLGLVFLGARHLVRWLGPASLIGPAVALTPMSVFSTGIVSTSGIEIAGGFAAAAVAAVCVRHPDSLFAPTTQITLGVGGSLLVLSRQMGLLTLCFALMIVVVASGWRRIWLLVRRPHPVLLASAGLLLASTAFLVVWELRFDRPSQTGWPVSADAWGLFVQTGFELLRSGVGTFGWMDSPLPRGATGVWLVVTILLIGLAMLFGRRRESWAIAVGLVATAAVAYVTYAAVFFPIQAGLQGRHMLPLFVFCPVMAGVVIARLRETSVRSIVPLLGWLVAIPIGFLQLLSVYWTARRYGVGIQGPVWFPGAALWSPGLGWIPWLVLAAVGAVALVFVVGRATSEDPLAANVRESKRR